MHNFYSDIKHLFETRYFVMFCRNLNLKELHWGAHFKNFVGSSLGKLGVTVNKRHIYCAIIVLVSQLSSIVVQSKFLLFFIRIFFMITYFIP